MSGTRVRIGLLDFGDLYLWDMVEVAELADRLGFSRYWLAEHSGGIRNALLATPLIAGTTSRIRVGPAGVLILYYAAAAVARDAIFLESVFDRIDLGIAAGRIPPGEDLPFIDGRAGIYLPETFEEKLRTVAQSLAAHSPAVECPELWVLGVSDSPHRGTCAARLHAHFCLSLIHSTVPPSNIAIKAYRDEEIRLGLGPGHACVALPMACVESNSANLAHVSPHRGILGAPFIGTPALCRERIEEVCYRYEVTEVSVLECSVGLEQRSASIQLLAEAFGGLPGPEPKGRVPHITPEVAASTL